MCVSDKLVIFLHMVKFKYLLSLIRFGEEGGCRIDLLTCQGLYDLFWVTGLLLALGPALLDQTFVMSHPAKARHNP